MNASHDNKHIPLLSLANILHKAGAINDALEIALAALESSPETVVIHFSIGNMYAAKVSENFCLKFVKCSTTMTCRNMSTTQRK